MPSERASSDAHERDTQDVDEFMGELRVALPGAQVVFAFLLTVPFSTRFDELDDRARAVYFSALCLAAAASILLITPSVMRQLMRDAGRDRLLEPATRVAFAGLGALAGSLICALHVVAALVFSPLAAALAAGAAGVVCAVAWVLLPVRMRRRNDD